MKFCTLCYSAVAKGISHYCSSRKKCDNMNSLMTKCSPHAQDSEKFCASVITNKLNRKSSGEIELMSSRKCMTLNVNPSANTVLNATNMASIQTDMNLSHRQTLKFAQHVRGATGRRSSIEPCLKQKLRTIDHLLDEHFCVIELDFTSGKASNNDLRRPVILCRDLENFLNS